MSRHCLVVAIVAVASISLAAPTATLSQGNPSVHGGFAFSTHVSDIGLMVGGYFPVFEEIKAGGEFTYYLTDDAGAVDFTLWTLNLNGAYPLIADETGLAVSAIAGLNILRWSGSYNGAFSGLIDFETSGTDIGLNAGAIVEYPVGPVNVFGKAHAVIGGGSSGLVFGGGVSKTFGGSSDNDG